MSFDPARPRYTLPFGKDYELIGTLQVIESIEWAMKDAIVNVMINLVNNMQTNELTKLIAALLTSCGHATDANQVADTIWQDIGLVGEANVKLRMHIYSFLAICVAPPSEREKRAKKAGEMMGSLTEEKASLGENTKKSA